MSDHSDGAIAHATEPGGAAAALAAAADPAAPTAAAAVDAPPQSGRAWPAGFFGLLLALCALAAAAAYWHQHVYRADIAGLRADSERLVQQHEKLSERLSAASAGTATLDAAQGALAGEIDGLRQVQGALEKSLSALYERDHQTPVKWLLAEAEYLVFAANQRLVLEGDVNTALAALHTADGRLRAAEHPDLIPIREQLTRDIAALEAVNLPDTEGLAIYLAELISRVAELPTKPIAELGTPFAAIKSEPYAVDNWRNLVAAVWSDLVSLIEVKDAELPDGVLFDPERRYFLQQNLRLELASARLAVLRRDTANLRASAGLIQQLLTAYYDLDDAAVSSMLARLGEAARLELAPALPDIGGSLGKIRGYRGAAGVPMVPLTRARVP